MITWTVANQKGGVGKTTTVVSLAGILSLRGHRVLLIDTDPHSSLTSYLNFDSDHLSYSLYDLFKLGDGAAVDINRIILKTMHDKIDLIPASITLATLDRIIGNRDGMGLVLKKELFNIRKNYDYVIIDCSPVLGVMMVNALAACDKIIIPVQTEYLALKGLDRMLKTLLIMQKSRSGLFDYIIIPTMFDKRTSASLITLKTIKEKYGRQVWNSVIPIDTKFRDASLLHTPPSIYSPNSRGSYAYELLLNTLDKIELVPVNEGIL